MSRLAWPIVLTQLAWVGMLTTDTAMIGRLGAEPLAGATLSLMVFFLTYVICFGVVTATASLASQAFGARQPRRVRRARLVGNDCANDPDARRDGLHDRRSGIDGAT